VNSSGGLTAKLVVGHGVFAGSFALPEALIREIPGSMVTLRRPAPAEHDGVATVEASKAGGTVGREQDGMIYMGDPSFLVEDDVRVWFSVGDASHVSVLGAASGLRLHAWQPPKTLVNLVVTLPSIGDLRGGPVSAHDMLESEMPRARLDVWRLRGLGFCCVWLAMSLMLFPNKIYPMHCGKGLFCLRSAPLAMLPTAAAIVSSRCFLVFPLQAGVATLLLLPILAAIGWGMDFKGCLCGRKRDESSLENQLLGALPSEDPWSDARERRWAKLREKAFRLTAIGIGFSLVVAGPIVRTVAVVDVFGIYVYAASTAASGNR